MILNKQQTKKLIAATSILLVINYGSMLAGTIKGKVIDSNTHESIPGAAAFVDKESNYVVTNVNGQYIFTNLKPGNYIINAKSAGYENSVPQQLIIKNNSDEISYDIYIKPKTTAIEEVKVVGTKSIETEVNARSSERLATNIINIVSAKTIEALPDQNVADVMQRVSGVSMTKNSFGTNSRAIIRGMPSRYNKSLVDGVLMPSTSSLGMLSSELVGRVEVIKSLQPDYEGDGIGGIVNVMTKQAPDTAFFKVQAGGGYNQYYFDHKFLTFDNSTVATKDFSEQHGPDFLADASIFPRKNLLVNEVKATPDLDISFSAGRRFFNKKLGAMVAFSAQNTSVANTYDYTSYFFDPNINGLDVSYWEHQVYSQSQKRYGGFTKLDYQFNNNNQISFYSLLFQTNEMRVREYTDLQNDNSAQNYRPIETQTETDNSGTSINTLKGEHNLFENLKIDWVALYVAGNSHSPDFVNIEEAKLGKQPPTLNYSKPVTRNWQWDIDQKKSANFNLNYKPDILGQLIEFKAGGMFRDVFLKNYANEYFFDAVKPGNYPYPNLLTVPLTNNQNAQQKKGNAFLNPGNYRAWEDIWAGYAMVTTTFGKLQILTGIRIESTYMRTEHNQNNLKIPVSGDTVRYVDPLPSLHLTYKITENQNLRFSVYKAINRQYPTEIIPYSDPRAGAQSGNPKLKHSTANCYDLRYEIYPKEEEVLTAGIFYKHLYNAIEEIVSSGSGNTSFQNILNCTNYGLEFVATKYFGNLGFSGNYTYTHSGIVVPKLFNYMKNGSDTTVTRSETRPLVGQSPHLINLSVSYRNKKWGCKSSVVYTMQGYNLVSPSALFKEDVYQSNYNNLGLSFDQSIWKRINVSLKVSNLLNSPVIRTVRNEGLPVEKSFNYQSYYIGLKFNL